MSDNVQAGLNRRDQLLVLSLATGTSNQSAAEAAGCATKTVQRRLADPGFRRALDETRNRLFEQALGRAVHHAVRAADVLAEIMDDADNPPRVRVSAAKVLLDSATRYRELDELARRVTAVEESVEAGLLGHRNSQSR